ncbi:MAG: hypothetical protein FRX49_08476 [Trebouxia sp. A1-2]|nr:MAG: hypothetical protein FRX49_08476 [Trebouxia sp. A1-2]
MSGLEPLAAYVHTHKLKALLSDFGAAVRIQLDGKADLLDGGCIANGIDAVVGALDSGLTSCEVFGRAALSKHSDTCRLSLLASVMDLKKKKVKTQQMQASLKPAREARDAETDR